MSSHIGFEILINPTNTLFQGIQLLWTLAHTIHENKERIIQINFISFDLKDQLKLRWIIIQCLRIMKRKYSASDHR